ncbi:spermidine synthase [Kitasatospora sp. RB6PN24]|nr:spermidine synthase [Kitasatospora humi]MCC9311289.1 spermidine synthase [Kitasatospora humi]
MRPRAAEPLVLFAAFVCAACGLVYELELVALGGYLLGDSVTQTSVVLSVMVFAMGVGSLLAKRLARRPATSFALVECSLALVGGLSVLVVYGSWAWLGDYQVALTTLTCVIGLLIGAEIPLLMTLVQRIRRKEAGRAAADLFAADYVGALIGGLAFPFLLLPHLGQAGGALLTGAVNAVAGGAVVLWLFRDEPGPRLRPLLWAGCGAVLTALAVAAAHTGAIERAARIALYGTAPRQAVQSRQGEIVLTGPTRIPAPGGDPVRLYLDGRLAACGSDEYRYHEALVHPALAGPADTRVLLLGGGDGLALREVLRHRDVASVLVVTADPALTGLARTDPVLAALGGHSFADPRVRVVYADPLAWLRQDTGTERFDAVLADLPAPQRAARGEYHTTEFYGLAAARLTATGRLSVPAPAGAGVWTAEAGLRAAGLSTVPFPVPGSGPACDPAGSGTRAAVLLAARGGRPELDLAADAPPPRAVTLAGLRAAAAQLASRRPQPLPPPSTLLEPR